MCVCRMVWTASNSPTTSRETTVAQDRDASRPALGTAADVGLSTVSAGLGHMYLTPSQTEIQGFGDLSEREEGGGQERPEEPPQPVLVAVGPLGQQREGERKRQALDTLGIGSRSIERARSHLHHARSRTRGGVV